MEQNYTHIVCKQYDHTQFTGSFLFGISYHLISTTNENCDGSRIVTILNDHHVILSRTETQFPHNPSHTQFIGGQLREARDDASSRCYGNQFYFRPAYPSDSWKFVG